MEHAHREIQIRRVLAHTHADRNANSYALSSSRLWANADSNINANLNPNAHSNPYSHADAWNFSDTYSHSDPNTESNGSGFAYTNSDTLR